MDRAGIDELAAAHPNPDSFHILLIRLPSCQVRENRQAPPLASVPALNSGSSHAQARGSLPNSRPPPGCHGPARPQDGLCPCMSFVNNISAGGIAPSCGWRDVCHRIGWVRPGEPFGWRRSISLAFADRNRMNVLRRRPFSLLPRGRRQILPKGRSESCLNRRFHPA